MGYYSWRNRSEVRTIQKVGNSFMVVIPRSHLERLELKTGDEVTIKLLQTTKAIYLEAGQGIIIESIKKEP